MSTGQDTDQDRRQSRSSSGNGLAGELESFAAGWAADRIRAIGDRAREGGGGDDGGGGGGGMMQDVVRSGLGELRSGGSPVGAAAKAAATGVGSKVKQAFGGKGGSGGSKVINIVEDLDVGVPVEVAWREWLAFRKFSSYMKGVDSAERVADDRVNFRAKVAWSHRSWESTITDEQENERLAWKSKGSKGSVDGVVTFHELGPNLTKMLVVLEYHPSGFFEKTGNLWRAQGRRARLDLKHFRRHVMTQAGGDEDDGDRDDDRDEREDWERDEDRDDRGERDDDRDDDDEQDDDRDEDDDRDADDRDEQDDDDRPRASGGRRSRS